MATILKMLPAEITQLDNKEMDENSFELLNMHIELIWKIFFYIFRYVHGIGSETRNSLFHLHNARDLVLVTTCRHGKSWRDLQDARCDEDNREYDR